MNEELFSCHDLNGDICKFPSNCAGSSHVLHFIGLLPRKFVFSII